MEIFVIVLSGMAKAAFQKMIACHLCIQRLDVASQSVVVKGRFDMFFVAARLFTLCNGILVKAPGALVLGAQVMILGSS